MQILWGCSQNAIERDLMAAWVAQRIWPNSANQIGGCVCMAVLSGNKIAGCVAYHNYDPRAGVIELSAAADNKRWLTKRSLKEMFEYPFVDLGVQMVIARTSADEKQAHLHKIFKTYGFKSQIIPRLYGRNEDGILFSLTDDDWRKSKFYRA